MTKVVFDTNVLVSYLINENGTPARAVSLFYEEEIDEDKKMFYQKIYNALNKNVSLEEIENKWLVNYKSEDRPTSLMNHINWLKDIGFGGVDVVWKYYNYAVYGGNRGE